MTYTLWNNVLHHYNLSLSVSALCDANAGCDTLTTMSTVIQPTGVHIFVCFRCVYKLLKRLLKHRISKATVPRWFDFFNVIIHIRVFQYIATRLFISWTFVMFVTSNRPSPHAGSEVVGLTINPLRFLTGCRTSRLNQALSVLSLIVGFFWCMCCAVN